LRRVHRREANRRVDNHSAELTTDPSFWLEVARAAANHASGNGWQMPTYQMNPFNDTYAVPEDAGGNLVCKGCGAVLERVKARTRLTGMSAETAVEVPNRTGRSMCPSSRAYLKTVRTR
jgi:hypothetical protein